MTREEQYLAKIAGEETEIPSEPRLRSEQYLAKIAGEDVGIPQKPLHNEETYLAILAGEDYEIPAPYNRIEQYMAKACGAEIEVPTPITRVEQLWAQIAEGGSWTVTEITGTLPLTFLSKGDDLIDYRIHGTSEGAGVETENILSMESDVWEQGAILNGGELYYTKSRIRQKAQIEIKPSTTYCVEVFGDIVPAWHLWEADGTTYISDSGWQTSTSPIIFTTPVNAGYIRFTTRKLDGNASFPLSDLDGTRLIMLTEGSTPPDHYIPHGYKLPLTVESGETENSFDSSMVFEPGYINNDGTIVMGNNMVHTRDYIPIKNSSQYVLTGKLVPRSIVASIAMYDAQKNYISRIVGEVGQNTIVFITKTNCSYVRLSINDGYDYFHYDPKTIMLTEGSTAPDHYIPHRYESNYDLFIGSTKLGEEEYVDYGEQKVYKRTGNLWDKDNNETFINPSTGMSMDRVVCHLTAGTYSILNGTNRDIYYFKASDNIQLACVPNSSATLIVEEVTPWPPFLYLQYADPQNGDITVVTGSTIPAQHIPYLQPTDPPVPLPPIPTYKGENTLSSTETLGEVTVKGRIKEIENG